jgi:hypothetical protein
VALALGAYAAALAEEGELLLGLVGLLAATLACVGALAGLAPVLVAGLGALVVEYAVAVGEQGRAELDTRAAVFGSGLLLAAELLFLAMELRGTVLEGGDLVARRLSTTFGVVTGSVVLGALLLAAAEVPAAGGLALQLAGVAAVAGVVALVLSLARR